MNIDISTLKAEAVKLPEPLKSLITLTDSNITGDEFVNKFIEWRKIARILDSEGKKK